MALNRRELLKAPTVLSVVGASDARAAASDPWIAFFHSTHLDTSWQLAFLAGLRGQNWEGDPTQDPGSRSPVNILYFNAGSRYRSNNSDNSNLQRAVQSMINDFSSPPKLFVATGGMVSALATLGITIPCLTIMGRYYNFATQRVGGYVIDDIKQGVGNVTLKQKAVYLQDSNTYKIDYKLQCLIYNANSNMGPQEKTEWDTIGHGFGVANPLSVDASFGNTDNTKMKVQKAINYAVRQLGAKAVIVSADPHMTSKRGRIINHVSKVGAIGCYPFQEYDDDAQDANLNTTAYMIYGPRLELVYQQLGSLAGQVLTNTSITLALQVLVPGDPSNPYYTGL
jgi:hypothetical protein